MPLKASTRKAQITTTRPSRSAAGAPGAFEAVFRMVRKIPRGRVMTYGQISDLLEVKLSPRAVGWAMNGCPDNVPWQRVVNAAGACSTDLIPRNPAGLQRAILEEEGVTFGPSGKLDLKRFRYTPRGPRAKAGKKQSASKTAGKKKATKKKSTKKKSTKKTASRKSRT